MNLLQSLRERLGAVAAAVIGSILVCLCGALLTFYLAPRQAIEANRIAGLPHMDADYVAAAAPGDDILISGTLVDNPALLAGFPLVAYELEEWEVTPPSADSEDTTPSGNWNSREIVSPNLNLDVGGQALGILQASAVTFGGSLHAQIVPGDSPETADYEGQPLAEGSLRYTGFHNGDLITVLGVRASTGQIIPEKLFGGDRVLFEESEADAAKGLLIGGIAMMLCAPVVLIGGSLSAVFGHNRRRGIKFG
jgi:hypothetical protein